MLKELRMRRGYSQAELAEKLGLGVRQLQKYEKQDYNPENMTLGVALKICELLSCSLQGTPRTREKRDCDRSLRELWCPRSGQESHI